MQARFKFLQILTVIVALLYQPVYAVRSVENSDYKSITVLAGTSLTNVMTILARQYSLQEGITVSVSFESPEELANDIEAGETADVYIAEDAIEMRDLKRQGMVDVFSMTNIAANQLALVISSKSSLISRIPERMHPDRALKYTNDHSLMVIGDPDTVTVGKYAMKVMQKLGMWEQVKPFIIRATTAGDALYLIAKGRYSGIVYYTDAMNNSEVEIVWKFEPGNSQNEQITYQAAVVAGENMPPARKFVGYLQSDSARNVFKQHGFITEDDWNN